MRKETVICIIIIFSIFSLELLTQQNTKQSVEEMTKLLEELKEDISNQDVDIIKDKIKEVKDKWSDIHDKLAYYIEHDELEKVDAAIVQMNSYVETKDFSSAIAELEEGKFVIEHIQDKTLFNLQNIF